MRRIIELVLAAMVLVATTSCGGGGADGTGGNPSPAQAHSISNVQGDGQTASPGAAVAIAPIRVCAHRGRAEGVAVHC